jgi:hypothetical protein
VANISVYMQQAMLDWVCGGASPTRPSTRGAAISTGSPTSAVASEVGAGSGYTRQTITFAAAGTPAGSGTVTNSAPCTWGTFNAAQSVSGLVIFDTLAAGAGSMLFYGLLAAARTFSSGDQLVLNTGALTITLS